MAAHIVALTDDTFDETVRAATTPVVVDFWASWCGPCKMLDPVIEELAEEHAGHVLFAKLNVDEELETTRRLDVMSMPTLIVFRDGEPVKRLVGARPKAALREALAEFMEPVA
jgi:thioredoxin 1